MTKTISVYFYWRIRDISHYFCTINNNSSSQLLMTVSFSFRFRSMDFISQSAIIHCT